MDRRRMRWLQALTHVGALTPLAALVWMALGERLGPVPVAVVTRLLGRYALALLLLSLVPTAIRIATGSDAVMVMRRPLGLYAFFYGALHALAFAGLDYRFDLRLLAVTLSESRREIVGVAALLILAILALTSIPRVMKGLGKAWQWLHRSVYAAAGLVVLHFVWNYKELRLWPVLAGATLLLLLMVRLPPIATLLGRGRRQDDQGGLD